MPAVPPGRRRHRSREEHSCEPPDSYPTPWNDSRVKGWSECHAEAGIDGAPVQRSPGVHGPAAVGGARLTKQRIPSRLSDVREVLAVDEQPEAAEAPLGQQPDNHVGLAHVAVWIDLEPLSSGEVHLDANPAGVLRFSHRHDAGAMPRREGHVEPTSTLGLA